MDAPDLNRIPTEVTRGGRCVLVLSRCLGCGMDAPDLNRIPTFILVVEVQSLFEGGVVTLRI